jgi:hypothetical protein
MNNLIGAIIFILSAFLLALPICILFYHRKFNKFSNEIDTFLRSKKLTFLRKVNPNNADWDNSPFNKPPVFRVSLGHVSFGGYWTSLTDTDYFIIETKENRRVWMEVQTTFLFKPVVNFKMEEQPPPIRNTEGKITFECPACKYVIFETDEICPDCGLHLK